MIKKVKIGEREFNLGSLTSLDLQKVEEGKEEKKLTDYQYVYYMILHGIKRYNPEVKFTLEEFMDIFPVEGMKEKIKEVLAVLGLQKTNFKPGVGEK